METDLIFKLVLGVIALAALAGTGLGLLLASSRRLWRVPLIIFVLTGFGSLLIPPSQQLKLGPDLAGGTMLVYEVRVPQGADVKQTVEQTIAVLRDRVDPSGVRNLIWREQAGNRIEIQMAEAPPETAQRRSAFIERRDALLAAKLRASDVDTAIREGRTELPGATDRQRRLLAEAAAAYQARQAARQPYDEAQQRRRDAAQALATLPTDAPDQQRQKAQANLDAIQKDLTAKTRTFLKARRDFDAARHAVLATNIEPTELENTLAILADPMTALATQRELKTRSASLPQAVIDSVRADLANDQMVSRREIALRRLIHDHPDKAEQVRAVAEAYAAYEQVKGPLDDPNDLIALLKGSGVLEFRIAPSPQEVPDLDGYRDQLREKGPSAGSDKPFRWLVIDDPAQFTDTRAERDALEQNAEQYFAARRGMVGQRYADSYYVLLANSPHNSLTATQKDWEVINARRTPDDSGFPAVGFVLNTLGGQYMGKLTGDHVGKLMAIVLDGRVNSAPVIRSRIPGQGIISGGQGGFSEQELNYLILTLKAGAIGGTLVGPISINRFGPQLGQDNLNHGLQAAIWAIIVVAGFMAIYYLFWGVVADFALFANMVIILGVMAMLDATFTLPGIAGIVLTIGMAVDANVLIFERIREELAHQTDLTTAVRLGYERALSTIMDANITTLIACVVLGYTATAEIKGFAVTLGIGILATLFTTLFCTRVIVNLFISATNVKHIGMLSTQIPAIRRLLTPNFNWIGKRYAFYLVSATLIVAGVLMVYERGQDMLDIEFRGGTQVAFDLAEGKTLSLRQVRDRLTQVAQKTGLADLAGDKVTVVTVGQTQTQGRDVFAAGFSVATLSQDASKVSEAIKTAFDDVLDVRRPIHFAGDDEDLPFRKAPVYKVENATLGLNISRPGVEVPVADYLGGVAIVLAGLDPAATLKDIEDRINRMRFQPQYESLGYRQAQVIGLDLDDAGTGYRSVVVVSTDSQTNYIEDPEAFDKDPTGLAQTEWKLVRDAMLRDTSLGSVSNFSSQVSNTMKQNAVVALGLSLLAVVIYIWFRFGSLRYGLAAIVALVHDVVIALGMVALAGMIYDTPFGQALALSDFKINLGLVAGVLAIVGYSLNDTIVVFDRVRENRGRLATASPAIVNDSINQTFSRTILTSGTTLLALLTLYTLGGDGVHGFAFMMIVGIFVGTYSSIAIASPILLIGQGAARQAAAKSAVAPATR
ncbi:MAG: protein translocase subunit SecD [Phycisphaeraceae bacterium]